MNQGFNQLIATKAQVRALLEGSSFHSDNFSAWEKARKFIAHAINQPGIILDIGCGNGFLLRCFQEWQPHTLVPFGIDTNPEYITQAKRLFPKYKDNFQILNVEKIKEQSQNFNLIYWNIWDNWQFDNEMKVNLFKEVFRKINPGGRLILGFYHVEKGTNLKKISELKSWDLVPQEVIENSRERWEIACWFDK